MPVHNGFLPREGFVFDVILKLLRGTAFNPILLAPLLGLAHFTEEGKKLAFLHPAALRSLYTLLGLGLAGRISGWFSDKVRNNWVSDKYDWKKEIVLITGGSGGVGSAVAKLFDEMNVIVVILDITPPTFARSERIHFYKCNLTSPEEVEAVAGQVKAEVGHPTVVINNAGVSHTKNILDAKPADTRFTFEVNSLAHYWILHAFLPKMVAENHGMIVNVASAAGYMSVPNMTIYGASKAAALALHEGLAAELTTRFKAPKVRTVLVTPGYIKTPLFAGFKQESPFVIPDQEPESIADGIFRQILKGKSGQVILPATLSIATVLRCFPDWYSVRSRAGGAAVTQHFEDKYAAERGKSY